MLDAAHVLPTPSGRSLLPDITLIEKIWRERVKADFPEIMEELVTGDELIDVFFVLKLKLQNALRAGDHNMARRVIEFCLWGLRRSDLGEPFIYNTEYFFNPVLESADQRLALWQVLSDADFAVLRRFFTLGHSRHIPKVDEMEREFRFRPRGRKT
jgi:hypothetical protein